MDYAFAHTFWIGHGHDYILLNNNVDFHGHTVKTQHTIKSLKQDQDEYSTCL